MTLIEVLQYIKRENVKAAIIKSDDSIIHYNNGILSIQFDADEGAKINVDDVYEITKAYK